MRQLIWLSLELWIPANERDSRSDTPERRSTALVVGFWERELYLYGLLVANAFLISAVLLFKAFSAWLSYQGRKADDGNDGMASYPTLDRFYRYAIGNFISLAVAIAIIEVLRAAVRLPEVKAILWIGS